MNVLEVLALVAVVVAKKEGTAIDPTDFFGIEDKVKSIVESPNQAIRSLLKEFAGITWDGCGGHEDHESQVSETGGLQTPVLFFQLETATMTITLDTKNTITTGTCAGRPVEFAQCMWCWIFADTDPKAAVEKVTGRVSLRNHK